MLTGEFCPQFQCPLITFHICPLAWETTTVRAELTPISCPWCFFSSLFNLFVLSVLLHLCLKSHTLKLYNFYACQRTQNSFSSYVSKKQKRMIEYFLLCASSVTVLPMLKLGKWGVAVKQELLPFPQSYWSSQKWDISLKLKVRVYNSLIKRMQFIPEREHKKAGKYIGLASPWDLKWGGVCVYYRPSRNLFSNDQFSLPTAVLCLPVCLSLCVQKGLKYY